ncbi:MAG TPA: glycerol-3-phosphate 1-O-acyltransferase [Chromatiales bacterium]|nr:glycerol-3-phosphate 1-O-acyltransferase PlsY [Thiotrichales bacterium]HIP68787.1 glycerol-3-phosphate 1-O-acyltransferase [Chromatiales bacterium]
MLTDILLIVSAYLIGSVSSAIIVCRLMGKPDPRTIGSRNPGATNVMRQAGKKAAIITLLGDVLKGVIPVLIAKILGASLTIQLLVAMAAFLGHLYPVYFGLKGGKGVATAMGVLLGLNWLVALTALAIWLLVYAIKRISSLSALTTTALAPIYIWLITHSKEFVFFGLLLTALIYWRHRSNIRNLVAGTET